MKEEGEGSGEWPKQFQTAIADLHQASPSGGQWSSVGLEIAIWGNSIVVQWLLGLCALIAKGPGSVPDWEKKILQAVQKQKRKKKNRNCDFRVVLGSPSDY